MKLVGPVGGVLESAFAEEAAFLFCPQRGVCVLPLRR